MWISYIIRKYICITYMEEYVLKSMVFIILK